MPVRLLKEFRFDITGVEVSEASSLAASSVVAHKIYFGTYRSEKLDELCIRIGPRASRFNFQYNHPSAMAATTLITAVRNASTTDREPAVRSVPLDGGAVAASCLSASRANIARSDGMRSWCVVVHTCDRKTVLLAPGNLRGVISLGYLKFLVSEVLRVLRARCELR